MSSKPNKESFDPLADFNATTDTYVERTKAALQSDRHRPKPLHEQRKVLDMRPEQPLQEPRDQQPRIHRPSSQKRHKPKAQEAVVAATVKVNIELTSEQKELLAQAAAWNKAFRVEPQTQKGIVQQALADFFRKHGFPKSN